MRRLIFGLGAALLLGSNPAAAAVLGFGCITNNLPGDCLIAEAQLTVDVTDPGGGQVLFTFSNSGPDDSSITDVYFDDGSLLDIASSSTTSCWRRRVHRARDPRRADAARLAAVRDGRGLLRFVVLPSQPGIPASRSASVQLYGARLPTSSPSSPTAPASAFARRASRTRAARAWSTCPSPACSA
jgi:hypothetical protein